MKTPSKAAKPMPKLLPSVEGYAHWKISGQPPTTIPELLNWLLAGMRERPDLVPLRPPYAVRVEWRFVLPELASLWPPMSRPGAFHCEAPSLADMNAVVVQGLALRGWIVRASMIARDGGSEKRWCMPGEEPGVRFDARTLHGTDTAWPSASGDAPDRLYPAAWQIAADVASVKATEKRNDPPDDPPAKRKGVKR